MPAPPDRGGRRKAIVTTSAVVVAGLLALVLILTSSTGPGHRGSIHQTPRAHRSAPPAQPPPPLRSQPPAQPPPRAVELGADVGLLFNTMTYSQGEINAQLAALARTGATVARSDALWEVTQPAPPEHGVPGYRWRFDDAIAGSLAAHRLRWLPNIDYSPDWVRSIPGSDHSPPASGAAYAAYAAALAGRYGVGGSFWREHPRLPAEPVETYEIWNEPDSPYFWKPRPDPAAYARLYERARAAIASVQPRARVIIGGLTRPGRFLPALLEADRELRGHIDGVAIHPYGRDPRAVLAKVRRARVTLRSLRLGRVPLYVTEFGWTIHPAGGFNFASASSRPRLIFLTMSALHHTDCGVAAAFLYAWFTPERNLNNSQDWFGIDSTRPRRTPGVSAFTRALRTRSAPSFASHLCARRSALR